ncbi:MAG: hypothetical protein ACI4L9_07045, partial [Candidatus Coproplasma sp.]
MFNKLKKQGKAIACALLAVLCAVCLALGLTFIKPATNASAAIEAPARPEDGSCTSLQSGSYIDVSVGEYNYILDSGDVTMNNNIIIYNGAVVNICLNGNTLNFASGRMIQVTDGGVLNIFGSGSVISLPSEEEGSSEETPTNFIEVFNGMLNVVGSTVNSYCPVTAYVNGSVGVFEGGKILNSSLGEAESPSTSKGIALNFAGNLTLSESVEIGYLAGRGTIDANGY